MQGTLRLTSARDTEKDAREGLGLICENFLHKTASLQSYMEAFYNPSRKSGTIVAL